MAGIAVVDIGEAPEAAGEGRAHGGLAVGARPPGVRTARHLEHAVIGKVGHDGIEIVRVEGVAQGFELTPDIAHHILRQRQGQIGSENKAGRSMESPREGRV